MSDQSEIMQGVPVPPVPLLATWTLDANGQSHVQASVPSKVVIGFLKDLLTSMEAAEAEREAQTGTEVEG